jgi:putative SOS response-associated peptidase YedK
VTLISRLVTCDLLGFLTTKASQPVETYHDKAMPVTLTTPEEIDLWMSAGRDSRTGAGSAPAQDR